MEKFWTILLLFATGLLVKAEGCSVDVYVGTGLAMSDTPLSDSKAQVTKMFWKIGIDLRIRIGEPAHVARDTCGAPIVLQLEESTGYRGGPDALAYAMPYKDFGTCIHVFVDRVTARNRDPAFARVLLAHVMAHEIAHVLECSVRHSEDGVMKARWSRNDYQRMKWRPLSFAPEDVESLRRGVARRIRPNDETARNNAPP
jgi:hypothetical protein